jgi:hypothetical protein
LFYSVIVYSLEDEIKSKAPVPQKPIIKLTPAEHRNQAVILLQFDYNRNLIDAVKK